MKDNDKIEIGQYRVWTNRTRAFVTTKTVILQLIEEIDSRYRYRYPFDPNDRVGYTTTKTELVDHSRLLTELEIVLFT